MPPQQLASKQQNCTPVLPTTHHCGLKRHRGRATLQTAPRPQRTQEINHRTKCGTVSSPPRRAVWPFLKPAVCRVKRNNKSLPKAQDCYYVGPGIDHPRDCIRVLTANRSILTTRNVTWRHVPLSRPAPPQQLPPIAEEGGVTAGEGASGERAPSQGGGGVEEVLDNESDLDDTEVGPMLTATREAETGAGAGGVAEGDPAAPSGSHGSRVSSSSSSSSSSRETAAAAETAAAEPAATPAPAEGTSPHSRGEKRTDRSGTGRYPHFKADARGPSRRSIKWMRTPRTPC